jgi:hypothetical protein
MDQLSALGGPHLCSVNALCHEGLAFSPLCPFLSFFSMAHFRCRLKQHPCSGLSSQCHGKNHLVGVPVLAVVFFCTKKMVWGTVSVVAGVLVVVGQ